MHDRLFIPTLLTCALAIPAAAQESKPADAPKTVPALRIVAGGQGNAQPPTQDQLKKRREEKLAKPVFKNADWVLDYDAARKRAKAEGKLILTYFTRSYAG